MKFTHFFDPYKEIDFVGKFNAVKIAMLAVPVISIASMILLGFNWGIDFSGGSEMQVKFDKQVTPQEIRTVLAGLGFDKNQVQSYGEEQNHEMLIRVERVATLGPDDLNSLTTLVKTSFGPESEVSFNDNIGDRVVVRLKTPTNVEGVDLNTALNKQQASLATLIDTKSGQKLRQTSKADNDELNTHEAILRGEPSGGKINYTVQLMAITDKIGQELVHKFGSADVRRVEFVDSQVSKQLRTDGALAVLYALIAILIYIAIRFDLLFAPGAIVALLQDTMGAILVFTFGRLEFDLPSIAALLTIVGYSINNTIVVYDRIRETVPQGGKKPADFSLICAKVNKSVNDTLSRTINTTLTTLFASVSLWLFAGGVIRSFALVLTVGITLGAISSTFTSPAVYLFMKKRFNKKSPSSLARAATREDKARGIV